MVNRKASQGAHHDKADGLQQQMSSLGSTSAGQEQDSEVRVDTTSK